MRYASIERSRLLEHSSDLEVGGPFNFLEIARGRTDLSPEEYAENFLQSLLRFILERYQAGIGYFSDSVNLRISFGYALAGLSSFKNEALGTTEFLKSQRVNLEQQVALLGLINYLENEELPEQTNQISLRIAPSKMNL